MSHVVSAMAGRPNRILAGYGTSYVSGNSDVRSHLTRIAFAFRRDWHCVAVHGTSTSSPWYEIATASTCAVHALRRTTMCVGRTGPSTMRGNNQMAHTCGQFSTEA